MILRGLATAAGFVVAIRVLDWLLAPLLVPLVVLSILVGIVVLAVGGPRAFMRRQR